MNLTLQTNPNVADDSRPTGPGIRLQLVLAAELALGAVAIWILRQPWARAVEWPWLLLIVAMFGAAGSLQRLGPRLPGKAILPPVALVPAGRARTWGARCLFAALALTALIAVRLLPDINKWHGLQFVWLAALTLVCVGAWLVGAVGLPSQRAVTALSDWTQNVRNHWLEILAFLAILGLAVFLRTFRLASIPPGIYVDETNSGLDALYVLQGRDVSPFATGWYETPNGYIYYMAALFKIFGANWTTLKLVSLIPAILTIPAVFLLGRELFGSMAGLIAMLLMAVSRWHLSLSRWGWNETAPPLFQVLSIYFLIRGLRDRRALDYALSGLLTGLDVYTYLSSRLAIATIGLYIIYWIASDPAGILASLRRSGLGLMIFVAATVVAVTPIGITYLKSPFSLNNRVSEISVFRDVQEQGSTAPLVQNVEDILKFFHQTGDLQGKHNLPGEPMADPITGLLFAIGVAGAILNLRDQRCVLLLMWLVIGLAGSFLSSHHESPQSYRALTALPAVVLLAADVLDRLARAVRGWSASGSASISGPVRSVASGGLVVLALAGAGHWESAVYFGPQANSIDVARGFNPTENGVAHETIDAIQKGLTVYLSPTFSEFSPLRFLLYGVVKAETGQNTLDVRPYHLLVPEIGLPLPPDGHDALILVDSQYWPLRDYVASFYPHAQMDLVQLRDASPIYMRIQVSNSEIAGLQGLSEQLVYADGGTDQRVVDRVSLDAAKSQPKQASWEGAVRLDDGGEYDFVGDNGLQVFVDGHLWEGPHYLGRGLYRLRAIWSAASNASPPRLSWRVPGNGLAPISPQNLFHLSAASSGLLGVYFNNANWDGNPVYQQLTPFLLLAWPDKPPVPTGGPFSARFTGSLRVQDAGTYDFRVEADDGARLTLDGKVIGEGLAPNQPNNFETTVELGAGDHPIQIDYVQLGGGSTLRFLWRHSGDNWTPVPPSALIPPQQ